MYNMSMETERDLPYFSLRQIDLPEVREWEVGGEYYLVMKVKMTGKRSRADLPERQDQGSVEGDFQMHTIKALDDKPVDVKTLEAKAFEAVLTRAKSGV